MSIADGKGLVVWEGGLFEPNSDLLHRVQWAFGKIRADGGRIILNEAGRPFGVPGDMNVRSASQTASGLSTVWFQWGRYLRGETPSAANPNSGSLASEHTQGKAIDCDAPTVFDATLRAKYFHQVGMVQTIASESWHWAIRSNPTVNIASAAARLISNNEEDEDMASGIVMQHPNGQMYLFGDNGDARKINSMDEVASLVQTNSLRRVRPDQPKTLDQYWMPAAAATIQYRLAIAARPVTGK